MTWNLPLWPLFLITAFALVAYGILWFYGRRLDRQAEEEKRRAAE